MAFIRASRGTMSVISPCLAGISKELTTPSNATITNIGHVVRKSAQCDDGD